MRVICEYVLVGTNCSTNMLEQQVNIFVQVNSFLTPTKTTLCGDSRGTSLHG